MKGYYFYQHAISKYGKRGGEILYCDFHKVQFSHVINLPAIVKRKYPVTGRFSCITYCNCVNMETGEVLQKSSQVYYDLPIPPWVLNPLQRAIKLEQIRRANRRKK